MHWVAYTWQRIESEYHLFFWGWNHHQILDTRSESERMGHRRTPRELSHMGIGGPSKAQGWSTKASSHE